MLSPGVIVTEVHKRGGMSEEDYKKVNNSLFWAHFCKSVIN